MNHLDLFSGIGGFALAVDAVWPGSNHIFCEIDPYCRALLKRRFGGMIYEDIRTLSRERLTADTDKQTETALQVYGEKGCGVSNLWEANAWRIDILTGGFPCQPFSQAGKRKGTDDNRYLWPEMLRVIKEFRPRWVIAENVRGILTINEGMVFEQVCIDLENEGYEVQPFVIPAVAVNAPHRRDRVWFVAIKSQRPDTNKNNAPDSTSEGLERMPQTRNAESHREIAEQRLGVNISWEQNWLEVATELCGMDDGLSAELDGFKLSKSRHRVERLKALGNAIVPQVAMEVMRAIRKVDSHLHLVLGDKA